MREHDSINVEESPQGTGVIARLVALGTEPEQLLQLQRTAGNRAVGALLRTRKRPPLKPSSRRSLNRYEAGEHVQFETGSFNVPLAGISGVDVRYLIAMGDFYQDPDALMNAKTSELQELIALIDRDEKGRTGKGGKIPTEDEWQTWSVKWRPEGQRYMDLNKKNESHFSPKNKSRWQELHKQALQEAQKAGSVTARARIINGFAAHYLTDAFSAGHLIDKAAVAARAKVSLDAGTNMDDLAVVIAHGIFADPGASARFTGRELKSKAAGGSWGPATEPRLASLLGSVMWWKESDFLNVFARLVHDNLDNAIRSGHGVWVTNKLGDRWQLSGDSTLSLSPKTLELAQKAVAASESNLVSAAAIPSPGWQHPFTPAIDDATLQRMFDNVWQFVPVPTTTLFAGEGLVTGQAQIDAAIAKFTNSTDPDARADMVKLSIEQIDTLIQQLEENKLIRGTVTPPAPPPAPPPTPAPKHTHVITLPDETLHFDTDKWDIDSTERDKVTAELEQQLGPHLEKAAVAKGVVVRGFTDSTGTDAHNMVLSQNRADSVKKLLEDRYPTVTGHVDARGFGKAPQLDANKTAAGRRANRRVEIEFQEEVVDSAP